MSLGLQRSVVMCLTLLSLAGVAHAQARATAEQGSELSVFLGGTGTYLGIQTAKNAGLTGGVDLAIHPYFGLRPAVEVRGTYPVVDGKLAEYKSFMGGLRVEKHILRYHPYVDFLIGRGELDFKGSGYYNNGYLYQVTASTVFSPGGGVDVDLTPHFAVKGDFQLQRQQTPAVDSLTVWSKAVTLAVVYRFDFKRKDTPPNNLR